MATSDHAGEYSAFSELVRNADVSQREFDFCSHVARKYPTDINQVRFAELLKTIAYGDRSRANKVLRGWGVR